MKLSVGKMTTSQSASSRKLELPPSGGRESTYLNNIIEQDHRFIKKRTRPMLGFKNFQSAKPTLSGIENIRMIQKNQIIDLDNIKSTFHKFTALMA